MTSALSKNAFFGRRKGPLLVAIMDGIGIGPDYAGNAVKAAFKPTLDALMASSLWTRIAAHGVAVGMPSDADMGNSEVGHNALGCGRVFDQGAKLVSLAIQTGRLKRALDTGLPPINREVERLGLKAIVPSTEELK